MPIPTSLTGASLAQPLTTEVGQRPEGRLGERTAQAAAPGPPRLAELAHHGLPVPPGQALEARQCDVLTDPQMPAPLRPDQIDAAQQRLCSADLALNARPAPTGSALARQFIELETVLHQLRSHFAARGDRFDPVRSDMAEKTLRRLEATLLKPLYLPVASLDNVTLRALGLSVQRMHMVEISQHLSQTAQARLTAVDLPYAHLLQATCEALRARDFKAMFDRLAEAADHRVQAGQVYRELGTALDSPGQVLAWRDDSIRNAVQQWDRASLSAVCDALDQPANRAMILRLSQLGSDILQAGAEPQNPKTVLSQRLRDAHIDLQMLRQAAADQLEQQGVAAPQVRHGNGPLADLDSDALAAMEACFGIVLRTPQPTRSAQ